MLFAVNGVRFTSRKAPPRSGLSRTFKFNQSSTAFYLGRRRSRPVRRGLVCYRSSQRAEPGSDATFTQSTAARPWPSSAASGSPVHSFTPSLLRASRRIRRYPAYAACERQRSDDGRAPPLPAIAAVVMGGTPPTGGVGSAPHPARRAGYHHAAKRHRCRGRQRASAGRGLGAGVIIAVAVNMDRRGLLLVK
jgi:hypothetical protein